MTESFYYPVAQCGGIGDSAAAQYDRRWLLVDQDGALLAGSSCGALRNVDIGIKFGSLVLRAPGMLRLDIPMDVIEDDDSVRRKALIGGQQVDVVDEGDLAATWFSTFLDQPCRLVKVHPDASEFSWPEL
jgi:uncharacterized protein YcbX